MQKKKVEWGWDGPMLDDTKQNKVIHTSSNVLYMVKIKCIELVKLLEIQRCTTKNTCNYFFKENLA